MANRFPDAGSRVRGRNPADRSGRCVPHDRAVPRHRSLRHNEDVPMAAHSSSTACVVLLGSNLGCHGDCRPIPRSSRQRDEPQWASTLARKPGQSVQRMDISPDPRRDKVQKNIRRTSVLLPSESRFRGGIVREEKNESAEIRILNNLKEMKERRNAMKYVVQYLVIGRRILATMLVWVVATPVSIITTIFPQLWFSTVPPTLWALRLTARIWGKETSKYSPEYPPCPYCEDGGRVGPNRFVKGHYFCDECCGTFPDSHTRASAQEVS